MNENFLRLVDQIKEEEGFSPTLYKCPSGKYTIGYGRNLEENPLTEEEAQYLLLRDIQKAWNACSDSIGFFKDLDDVRKCALVDMAFNMGIRGLLRFVRTLEALSHGNYPVAAAGIRSSLYASQVGKRAERIANMIETGHWPE